MDITRVDILDFIFRHVFVAVRIVPPGLIYTHPIKHIGNVRITYQTPTFSLLVKGSTTDMTMNKKQVHDDKMNLTKLEAVIIDRF